MSDANNAKQLTHEYIVSALAAEILDPNLRRIIQACNKDDPLGSMEAELGRILLEGLEDED